MHMQYNAASAQTCVFSHPCLVWLQSQWMEEVRHAYCTSTKQCQQVTNAVADIIVEGGKDRTYSTNVVSKI